MNALKSLLSFATVMFAGVIVGQTLLSGPSASAQTGVSAPRPHIVIFLADDLGWSDCSIYNPQCGIRTPNMERLAQAGMTFTHAFVASPSCAPSRGVLLTGLSPVRNGAMFNHTVPEPSHKRWPAWFQELGYEVAAIGKVAHYATVQQYGFDHCSHFNYHQDDCIDAALAWLDQRASRKPLCLFVGTNWPHVPWPEKSDYSPDALPLPPTQVDTPETRQYRARYAAAVASPTATSAAFMTPRASGSARTRCFSSAATTARSSRSANGTSTTPVSGCRSWRSGPAGSRPARAPMRW